MSLLERTLSEIARPRWEGTPRFEETWRSVFRGAQRLEWPREAREWCCDLLVQLAACRVLVIDSSQINVLPAALPNLLDRSHVELGRDLQGALSRATLPFERVFLDFGRATCLADGLGEDIGDWVCLGALAGHDYVVPFTSAEAGVVFFPGGFSRNVEANYMPLRLVEGFDERAASALLLFAVERTAAVLQWLESENVEIADQPVSRQVRRAAERKGAEIAKIVRVKLPRSWRNGQPPPPKGNRNWTHRWEVRGHYMYFPETTRLAQAAPDKLSWVPERNGYFRRLWCPPHVKGPADKPLIPKTRKLVGAEA